ncbi:hypothetical protein LCGC14_1270560 [marine sediment metagenome]|uniref:Uncharacterized protein n=1 Tax=marine sediment metagenome TaxID=412755 RepID=A0A0F9L029_9ZZZZ
MAASRNRRRGVSAKQRLPLEDTVPRPLCGCGKNEATHQVTLTVRRLVLDREAGARTNAYWTGSYRSAHTSIEAIVCDDCLASKINVAIAVDATLAQAKKVPPP